MNYVTTSVWEPDVIFTKAKGAKIWLNNKPYLDFACGPGVANIGYNRPEIIKEIKRVYSRNEAGYGGNMLLNKYQLALAEELCRITPGKFSKRVFFSNSGGEAVEAAIIACMKRRPERPGMVSFLGDFHGRLGFGRTATTSKLLYMEGLPRGIQKAHFLAFPAENPETPLKKEFLEKFSTAEKYLNYVENTIGPFIHEINFALFELIQGEGGINVAKKEMIQALVGYLRKNKIWVIIDEVQTGLGRTGKMWASEIYEIEPDIMTVAKALSGGVIPIGATILREDLDYQQIGEHCNTFGANPPACAVGLKVLEIIQRENLAEQSENKGQVLRERLRVLLNIGIGCSQTVANNKIDPTKINELVYDISGRGLMNRITFLDSEIKKKIIVEARKLGLFLTGAGERSIRLMPPLTINDQEIEKAIEILVEVIRKAHQKP